MPTEEIKQLIEEQGRAFEQFKAANDLRLKDIEKKSAADPVTDEKVDKLNAELTAIGKKLEEAEKRHTDALKAVEKKALRADTASGRSLSPEAEQHKQAFGAYLRKDDDSGLRDLGIKATTLTTQSGPDGGFLVPEELEASIARVMGTMSAMRSLATVVQMAGGVYKKNVSKGGATATWYGEGETRSPTTTPQLAELEFHAYTLTAKPSATQEMLDDSRLNIEQWLADEVGITFAETEGDAFIDGTGVKQPRGLLSYTMVANASYAWGSVGYVASGKADGFAASKPGDKFYDLVHSLKRGYRANGAFLMNDLTVAALRKFVDGLGNYIWQPGLQAGVPSMLCGYPVVTDDNMPDVAADAYPIAFGDFRRAYLIVDRVGTTVLRDPYTTDGAVTFRTRKRVGGGIQNFEAVKVLKISA